MSRLAHLSDLHATPVRVDRPLDFASKRLLGWLSWRVRRREVHRPETLAALVDDARRQVADQVVVTGQASLRNGSRVLASIPDTVPAIG